MVEAAKGGHGGGVDPGVAGDRWQVTQAFRPLGGARIGQTSFGWFMRRSASADCGLCSRAMHRRVLS
jgi:hypothetical protein